MKKKIIMIRHNTPRKPTVPDLTIDEVRQILGRQFVGEIMSSVKWNGSNYDKRHKIALALVCGAIIKSPESVDVVLDHLNSLRDLMVQLRKKYGPEEFDDLPF